MTPKQTQAQELKAQGLSQREIAKEMNLGRTTVQDLLRRGDEHRARLMNQSEGLTKILESLKLQDASMAWIKTPEASVLVRAPVAPEKGSEAWVEALRAGLTDLPAVPAVRSPEATTGRLVLFPLADLHIGLLCDEEEVGEHWDIPRALEALQYYFEELVDQTPKADIALVAQLGDLLHADDKRSETPLNHHKLSAAAFFRSLRGAIAAMKMVIEILRRKYPKVIYSGRRGNHDENAHYAITLALSEHYHNSPDVEIVMDAEDIDVHEYGCNLIALHHGDRMKPEAVLQHLTGYHAQAWGRTKYRISVSGHIHHLQVKSIGGLRCESVGTIIPGDDYARSHGYVGWRELVSISLDHDKGERSRSRVGVN